mgnify:CR=1 FL=1
MAIVFKYKNPKNREYAPGFVNMGQNGESGHQGSHGNSLFILDYELNNSYNIELTLQKIDKNLSLSSLDTSLNNLLSKRPYKEGDILMTSDKIFYKLIKSSSSSLFNNYKFDIKKLGGVRNSYKSNIKSIKIFDFTGTTILYDAYINSNEMAEVKKEYSSVIKTCYPNHKYENAKARENFYDNDSSVFYNNCVWLKFVCVVDNKISNNSNNLVDKLNSYIYSLEMNLYNEKLIDNNCIPSKTYEYEPGDSSIYSSDLSKYKIPFYKKLEIPNISVISDKNYLDDSAYENDLNELLFGECFNNPIYKDNISNKVFYNKTPRCSTLCLDDFGLDSIHPSKNNIKCTLDNQKWMWFNQKASSYDEPFNDLYYNIDSKTVIDDNDNDVILTHKIMKPFIEEINGPSAGNTFIESKTTLTFPYHQNKPKEIIDNKNLGHLKWISLLNDRIPCMGGFLKTSSLNDIQKELDSVYVDEYENIGLNKSLLQFSIYDLWNKDLTHKKENDSNLATYNNFAGNSLYFSSMKTPEDFHGNMLAYITNNKNIFNIYSTLPSSKKTTMTNITFELDTTYAYKTIKVSKGRDKKIHVKILN